MSFSKWIRIYYKKTVESIAFYPALIAVGFLILSWGMLAFDFSDYGKQIKSGLSWLSLKDASTARTIISTVADGKLIITFAFRFVFSRLIGSLAKVTSSSASSCALIFSGLHICFRIRFSQ